MAWRQKILPICSLFSNWGKRANKPTRNFKRVSFFCCDKHLSPREYNNYFIPEEFEQQSDREGASHNEFECVCSLSHLFPVLAAAAAAPFHWLICYLNIGKHSTFNLSTSKDSGHFFDQVFPP